MPKGGRKKYRWLLLPRVRSPPGRVEMTSPSGGLKWGGKSALSVWVVFLSVFGRQREETPADAKWHGSYISPSLYYLVDTSRRIKQLPAHAARLPGVRGQLLGRLLLLLPAHLPGTGGDGVCLTLFLGQPPVHAPPPPVLPLRVPAFPPGRGPGGLRPELAALGPVLPADPPRRARRLHQSAQRALGPQVLVPGRAAAARAGLPRRLPAPWPVADDVTRLTGLRRRYAPPGPEAAARRRPGPPSACGGRPAGTGGLHTSLSTLSSPHGSNTLLCPLPSASLLRFIKSAPYRIADNRIQKGNSPSWLSQDPVPQYLCPTGLLLKNFTPLL